ncbi:MAG: type IV secretory system conjugative DNA transfer family protein [Pyrinomonadaceae bacterium]
MKYTNTLTAALVALLLTLTTSATAQTGATAQATPDTRTTTEREQDAAAERWRVQERARLQREKEASAATPAQNNDAGSVPDSDAELHRQLDADRRGFEAESKKAQADLDRRLNQASREVRAIGQQQPQTAPAQSFSTDPIMQERARAGEEARAKFEQQQRTEAEREQKILPLAGLFLALMFLVMIAGAIKYPKTGIRAGLLVAVFGAAGFAILFYLSRADFYSGQNRTTASVIITIGWNVSLLIACIGIAKAIANLCAIPKDKTVRLVAVLIVSFGIIFAGGYMLDVSTNGSTLRLAGLFTLLAGIFSFVGGMVKAARGSSASGESEDAYHGSARFATDEEINELTVKRGQEVEPGSFILAPPEPEKGRKAQVVLPRMQTTQHGLILGGTGTGKSRGYFLPNCAQVVDTSLVVTDPKSELWKLTSGFREKALRYAPADPDASAGFNWIQLCNDARMAELCARAIIASGNTSHTDQFFIDTESAFLAALFAHAATLPEATPLTAYGLFTKQPQEDLMKQLLESPSEVARDQAVIFMQTDSRYRGAIVPAVSGRLQFMRDKAVRRFTSATLDAPDFGRLRQEPTALYWCLREQDIVRLRPLTSLFFTVLLEQIAGAPEGGAGVPVTMMLDEFANIGTIPDFETTISLARGRGVALWLGVQSLSQLDKSYGRENAQTIITNCSTKIALHGLDYNTAKYVSDMLGESTIVAKRHGFSFSPTGLISVSRHGTEHRKMLLTPDEVMRLSETEAIIRTGNKYPMTLKKGYYDEPARTAHTSTLGDAITKDFPPLVLAGSAAATGDGLDGTANAKQTEAIDLL